MDKYGPREGHSLIAKPSLAAAATGEPANTASIRLLTSVDERNSTESGLLAVMQGTCGNLNAAATSSGCVTALTAHSDYVLENTFS